MEATSCEISWCVDDDMFTTNTQLNKRGLQTNQWSAFKGFGERQGQEVLRDPSPMNGWPTGKTTRGTTTTARHVQRGQQAHPWGQRQRPMSDS